LRLDLATADQKHRRRAAEHPGEQHLYDFFVNEEEPEILRWLGTQRHPLSPEDARFFLLERSELLRRVDEATRRLLLRCYPELKQ
jgi:hypothetical protein